MKDAKVKNLSDQYTENVKGIIIKIIKRGEKRNDELVKALLKDLESVIKEKERKAKLEKEIKDRQRRKEKKLKLINLSGNDVEVSTDETLIFDNNNVMLVSYFGTVGDEFF